MWVIILLVMLALLTSYLLWAVAAMGGTDDD